MNVPIWIPPLLMNGSRRANSMNGITMYIRFKRKLIEGTDRKTKANIQDSIVRNTKVFRISLKAKDREKMNTEATFCVGEI